MKYYECSKCTKEFLVKRDFCPKCFSEEIIEKEFNRGAVVYSVKLIATPENFPDEYYVIMGKFSSLYFFCRSTNSIETGTEIEIKEEDGKSVCFPAI